MKKTLGALLAVVLLFCSSFMFASCDDSSKPLPDFADCEIGYKLEVYPKVAFDYKISEDCIVHIESISATLTKKNVINKGDVIEGNWYPYEIVISITGTTNGNIAYFFVTITSPSAGYSINCTVTDGQFNGRTTIGLRENEKLFFYRCTLPL